MTLRELMLATIVISNRRRKGTLPNDIHEVTAEQLDEITDAVITLRTAVDYALPWILKTIHQIIASIKCSILNSQTKRLLNCYP